MDADFSNTKDAVTWAVDVCRSKGLRRTKALEELLTELIESKQPRTLADLSDSDRLREQCDKATVFRLLTRLEERKIIRRLGLHDRSAYFTMKFPGKHDDYLICTGCGSIEPLDMKCPVEKLETEVAERSGFSNLTHELEFFGTCPTCT